MEEKTLKQAFIEATVNAVTIFALSLGMLILGKQTGQLAADITMHYIILQAGAVGLIRFASYMYATEENVTPGQVAEQILPTGDSKGQLTVQDFFRRHPVGKLI